MQYIEFAFEIIEKIKPQKFNLLIPCEIFIS